MGDVDGAGRHVGNDDDGEQEEYWTRIEIFGIAYPGRHSSHAIIP